MLAFLARIVLALVIIVSAAAMPGSVRAMPMLAGMSATGMDHCPKCPQPARSDTNPDKMPACQVLACAGAVATLPMPAVLPGRVPQQIAYLAAPRAPWAGAARTPDPFPPRQSALV